MRVGLSLTPGQNGTKKLVREYGDRLVCVRYRDDPERGIRYKTAGIIADETPWTPPAAGHRKRRHRAGDLVHVRVEWHEHDLRAAVKAAGAIWRPRLRLWELDYDAVTALGLRERIVEDE